MTDELYLPWRAVQREWGYPDYEGGPEVRLWEVHDARGTCVVMLTIHCRSKDVAERVAAAINATGVRPAPTVDAHHE